MKNTISMNVSAIGTDDGKSTFEVQRTWNEKKHPMKKKKRWYSYDIILPENGGRIYVIYCMYEEHLRDIGVI